MADATVEWNGPDLLARARDFRLDIDRTPGPDGEVPLTSGEALLISLGMCTAGTLQTFVARNGLPLHGLRVSLHSERRTAPTRFDDIEMVLELEGELTSEQLATVYRIANACTVGNTLRRGAGIRVTIAGVDPATVDEPAADPIA